MLYFYYDKNILHCYTKKAFMFQYYVCELNFLNYILYSRPWINLYLLVLFIFVNYFPSCKSTKTELVYKPFFPFINIQHSIGVILFFLNQPKFNHKINIKKKKKSDFINKLPYTSTKYFNANKNVQYIQKQQWTFLISLFCLGNKKNYP